MLILFRKTDLLEPGDIRMKILRRSVLMGTAGLVLAASANLAPGAPLQGVNGAATIARQSVPPAFGGQRRENVQWYYRLRNYFYHPYRWRRYRSDELHAHWWSR